MLYFSEKYLDIELNVLFQAENRAAVVPEMPSGRFSMREFGYRIFITDQNESSLLTEFSFSGEISTHDVVVPNPMLVGYSKQFINIYVVNMELNFIGR